MVQLLASAKSNQILVTFLPQLVKEHNFWMKGSDQLSRNEFILISYRIRMSGGEVLNRYWDENETPDRNHCGKMWNFPINPNRNLPFYIVI